jgi:hypothetical protein
MAASSAMRWRLTGRSRAWRSCWKPTPACWTRTRWVRWVRGREDWAEVAAGIVAWVEGTLALPDGLWAGSLDADEDYFAAAPSDRAVLPAPRVDTTVNTAWNARWIAALAAAGMRLDRPAWVERAEACAGHAGARHGGTRRRDASLPRARRRAAAGLSAGGLAPDSPGRPHGGPGHGRGPVAGAGAGAGAPHGGHVGERRRRLLGPDAHRARRRQPPLPGPAL